MTDGEKRPPRLAETGLRRGEERQDRQAKALRENLLKRKAQQRARTAPGDTAIAGDGGMGPHAESDV